MFFTDPEDRHEQQLFEELNREEPSKEARKRQTFMRLYGATHATRVEEQR